MKKEAPHNSKEFFIDGTMINVRPLQHSDPLADKPYSAVFSDPALIALGGLQHWHSTGLYDLSSAETGHVYLAVKETGTDDDTAPQIDHLPAGLAVYAKNEITGSHEMAIAVTEEFIDTRLPYELADSLVKDAASHRVMTLYTTDSSTNTKLAALAQKLGMSVRIDPDRTDRTVSYSLQVDKHPGIVVF